MTQCESRVIVITPLLKRSSGAIVKIPMRNANAIFFAMLDVQALVLVHGKR